MSSTRFAVGVHVLVALASHEGEPVPSEAIAASVNTNPSFIRHVLSQLREANLVRSRLGKGGGGMLARPASAIRLDEVYRATESRPMIALHHSEPSRACPVGKHIRPVLGDVIERAERALLRELGRVTVADVAGGVRRRS